MKQLKTENDVKRELKKMLDEIGAFHFPASAGAFSIGGVSDRLACYKGRFVAIECKRPGRRGEKNAGLSGLQVLFGEKVKKAGGLFFVVDGLESIQGVRLILKEL